jgi:hypothetical protein
LQYNISWVTIKVSGGGQGLCREAPPPASRRPLKRFGGFCRFLEENKSVPFFSINIHLDMVCHKWYTYQERRKDHAH